MPAGLDGNPDPVVTLARTVVLEMVAERVGRCRGARVLVGVDGRSGAGKSTFADELARTLEQAGRSVVRSATDSFHRPREQRMRLGESSPEGFYWDSYQTRVIIDELLVPFRDGASEVLVGAFDEPSDTPRLRKAVVPTDAILVFDGLFVHRPELCQHWNLTVTLHADRRCDDVWLRYLETDLPHDPTDRAAELDRRLERARWPRYRHGWQLYLEAIGPAAADIDIDNENLSAPAIINDGAGTRPLDHEL
jgi:uridine kinase